MLLYENGMNDNEFFLFCLVHGDTDKKIFSMGNGRKFTLTAFSYNFSGGLKKLKKSNVRVFLLPDKSFFIGAEFNLRMNANPCFIIQQHVFWKLSFQQSK